MSPTTGWPSASRPFLASRRRGRLPLPLNATTAIVIGTACAPPSTGVAPGPSTLDASYLWTTPQERDTVSETPDPRADYGNDPPLPTLWRYVKNNQSAIRSPVLERASRSTADLVGALGSLLYHELTLRQRDFLPARLHTVLNGSLRVH